MDAQDQQRLFAIRLSLAAGLFMLAGKTAAWWWTGSSAILADASESVIHVFAVGFAAFSLQLSQRPADARYPFGYDRISFLSAGFEGALITLAAASILVTAIHKWITGIELAHLGLGTAAVAAAAAINLALGLYLVRTGRRTRSIILEANGKHVLTDSWTSFAVIAGLGLVMLTGWKPFDPIVAILAALNITWSGGMLVWRSATGLMDYADPNAASRVAQALDSLAVELGVQYHGLRFRSSGARLFIELHLLFPAHTPIGQAHAVATELERRLPVLIGESAEVVTHLEALEDHGSVHGFERHTGLSG